MRTKKGKFRYIELADTIQRQIEKGAFNYSEKLPSLRMLCQKTGYSMSTVFQAYIELEKRGIIESRHRSGYFMKPRLDRLRKRPKMKPGKMVPKKIKLDDMIHQLTEDIANQDMLRLGSVAVAAEHLPFKQLHKQLKSIPKEQVPDLIAGYGGPQGDPLLRHQISNLLFPILPTITMEDIIITNGCTDALYLSLKAVAQPGDTVLIESPSDPWLRQTLKDSGIYTLEIPTRVRTGVDLDFLEAILHKEKISACILNPNCQNPMGFIMPDENKKRLLEILSQDNISLIENDVNGDLYFGEKRPVPVKKWDTHNNVLYCSSFSKVLSPGLRVGWVVPGRFKEKIMRMKLNRSLISPKLNQTVVATYLKQGSFHRHLRKLRKTIKLQYTYCAAAVDKYFPDQIKMTSPAGGQSLWIELPGNVHSREVYAKVREKNISILPGFLCTSHQTFNSFIRIGYGGVWNAKTEQAVRTIGNIVKQMI